MACGAALSALAQAVDGQLHRAIRSRRGGFFLASKCGCPLSLPPGESMIGTHDRSAANVRAGVEQSLRRGLNGTKPMPSSMHQAQYLRVPLADGRESTASTRSAPRNRVYGVGPADGGRRGFLPLGLTREARPGRVSHLRLPLMMLAGLSAQLVDEGVNDHETDEDDKDAKRPQSGGRTGTERRARHGPGGFGDELTALQVPDRLVPVFLRVRLAAAGALACVCRHGPMRWTACRKESMP